MIFLPVQVDRQPVKTTLDVYSNLCVCCRKGVDCRSAQVTMRHFFPSVSQTQLLYRSGCSNRALCILFVSQVSEDPPVNGKLSIIKCFCPKRYTIWSLIHHHTPVVKGCHARCRPAYQEQLGVQSCSRTLWNGKWGPGDRTGNILITKQPLYPLSRLLLKQINKTKNRFGEGVEVQQPVAVPSLCCENKDGVRLEFKCHSLERTHGRMNDTQNFWVFYLYIKPALDTSVRCCICSPWGLKISFMFSAQVCSCNLYSFASVAQRLFPPQVTWVRCSQVLHRQGGVGGFGLILSLEQEILLVLL